MAFGSSVTQIDQNAIGSYGFIAKINSANLLAQIIESVQAQAGPSSTPAPVVGSVGIDTLHGYLNTIGCPDLAYSYSDGECSIFFKTSVFPYSATTRYAIFGKRKAQTCSIDSDTIDCSDRDLNLLIAYCLELAYTMKKGGATKAIYDSIKNGEKAIRNE